MGTSAALADSTAILKRKYNQPKVYWLAYKANPEINAIRKDESYGGEMKIVAVQTEVPQGGGSSVAQAQTNRNQGTYRAFQCTHRKDYGVARIDGDALDGAQGKENALIDLWKREMDGIIHHVTRSLAIHSWRSGTGSRGQLDGACTVASTKLTLKYPSEISNFAVNMPVYATDTDGGTLRNAGATCKITGVNRRTGDLIAAANWSASIGALVNTDFLYRAGDLNKMIVGREAWVPASDPSATLFYNVDRTEDYVRLSGQRLDAGSGTPMTEVLIEALSMIDVEMAGQQGEIVAWMHPRDRAQFVKELEGKVTYTRVQGAIKGSAVKVGFTEIEAEIDGIALKVRSTVNLRRGKCFVSDESTWALESMGPAPKLLDRDKLDMIRVSDDDSYEVRVGYYAFLSNAAPCGTVNVSNFGA